MKVHTEYLKFHTRKHREYIHITPQVEAIVKKSGIKEGMVLVSAMHITAGIYVNDNESGLIEDIDQWLEQLAPFKRDYKHHETGEDNGDSHLKALLIHHEIIVPIGRAARFRNLAADFLRRIRRSAREAGDSESNGRMKTVAGGQWSVIGHRDRLKSRRH